MHFRRRMNKLISKKYKARASEWVIKERLFIDDERWGGLDLTVSKQSASLGHFKRCHVLSVNTFVSNVNQLKI